MNIHGDHHLSYCTNIHAAESLEETLQALKDNIPQIKEKVAPDQPFGIGLRLSARAVKAFNEQQINHFKSWLSAHDCYVYTINGFPFGNFNSAVKDQVHAPDWTTAERLQYTKQLAIILAELLPDELKVGSISTSPISYSPWHKKDIDKHSSLQKGAEHLVDLLQHLYLLQITSQKNINICLEPEPDGLLQTTEDFIHFYEHFLIPAAIAKFPQLTPREIILRLKNHITFCWDICHLALMFEDPIESLGMLQHHKIKIGKVQISAALIANFQEHMEETISAVSKFIEPTYLHQVIQKTPDQQITQYRDLKGAVTEQPISPGTQWRIHFHVPIHLAQLGILDSTQHYIIKTIQLLTQKNHCQHWEVETYTWNVLPEKEPVCIQEGIANEINWAKNIFLS
ncbi:metabolite traffic protein EboE [Persicobacter sp. CCB-QB2]|uniref:metabolite traffic protein EboE n=1 Tax=Persicobacter sp. CCB-QB2 TaxID=1561025 RepID=UPI0006A96189|nr:metabolite traffic protein EboE [Persicobacter sp. CCB-QB2]